MYILFLHLSINRQFDCFYFLVIMNNVAGNICAYFLIGMYVFSSLRWTPRIRISGLYDNSRFNILRNFQTLFQSDYIL